MGERLEMLERANELKSAVEGNFNFSTNIQDGELVEWLIEQAKKVGQLEKTNRKLNHEIGAYSGNIRNIAEKLLILEKEMLNA